MIARTSLASLLLPSESPSSELQRLRRETISLPENTNNNLYQSPLKRKKSHLDWLSNSPLGMMFGASIWLDSILCKLLSASSSWMRPMNDVLKDRIMYNLDSLPHGQVVHVVQDEAAHLESLLVLLGVDLPTHLLLQLLCSLPLWPQAQGVFKND